MDTVLSYLVAKALINIQSQEYIDRDIDYTFMIYLNPMTGKWIEDKFECIKAHIIIDIHQILDANKEKITSGGR